MGWIRRGLSAEEDLWKIVWIYGALLIFFAKVAVVILRLASDIDFDNPTAFEANTMIACKLLYGAWFFISVWRCAFNVYTDFWGYLARGLLILYVLLFAAAYLLIHAVLDPFELINGAVDYARNWAHIEK